MKQRTDASTQLKLSLPGMDDSRVALEEAIGKFEPTEERLTTVGLFAGVGGLEVGLARYQHETTLLCENDGAAQTVLEKHFFGIDLESDARELRRLPSATQLLTAGFPCQDLSQVGQTAGIEGSRSGLVGEVFRLLGRKRVPWVLIENVPFMLQLAKGRALEVVVSELERLGYRWAYRVVDTRAFGLPQRRKRVFLLASRVGDPREVLFVDDAGEQSPKEPSRGLSFGFYWTEGNRGLGAAVDAIPTLKGGSSLGIPSPPAIVLPHPFKRIVTPNIRDAERLQGFDEDWTLPAERRVVQGRRRRVGHRWKLVGNAVTVDVAAWLGYRLRQPGTYEGAGDPELPIGSRWPRAAWGDGRRRYSAAVCSWPVRIRQPPLHQFLQFEPKDLSEKATAGFRERLTRSTLQRPEWFEPLLDTHLKRMRRNRPR